MATLGILGGIFGGGGKVRARARVKPKDPEPTTAEVAWKNRHARERFYARRGLDANGQPVKREGDEES